MVRIVKSEPHPSVVKEHICRNCGATLEYTPKDIVQRTVSDYRGDSDVFQYINCPQCKSRETVKQF